MLPPETHPAWNALIKGERKHKFSYAAASMLFFNLQSQYRREPLKLDAQVREARRFFEQYEAILRPDIVTLFGD